jgi:hypothetical protein
VGGTGATTLTDGGIVLGSGTAAVTVTAQPTNGQMLIGSTGVDPVLGTIAGVANETDVTTGAGTLTVGIVTSPTLDATNITGIPAGAYDAASIDGDDIASSIAGKGLDYTAGTPDVIDAAPVRVCKTLFDTGNLAATDDVPDLWSYNAASTVVDIDAISSGGTSITITIEDDAGNDLVTSCVATTSWTDCGTVSNAAMTADERLDWTTVSVSGNVTSATVCVDHQID